MKGGALLARNLGAEVAQTNTSIAGDDSMVNCGE
jgi:hypothetical protein